MPPDQSNFASSLASVEERIERALLLCGRRRADVTLVAVSKKFSAEKILMAYESGLRHFGENYVQEFAEKRPQLTNIPDACYHLIGHLQSNKARVATELFHVIQTVDSPKLLRRLNDFAGEGNRTLETMLEVKLSNEESKSGVEPQGIEVILETATLCSHVNVTGLMTIPPESDDPQASRKYFRQLADLARSYKLPKLSMGMSADFEVAITEGATAIRVGTALFGRRPKPQPGSVAL